ncbi:hypothetical protein J6590_065967 [Homalodisca vitripennis]|nr:hypothetical protein J6590_065967 [Homalodisca vitripennis]
MYPNIHECNSKLEITLASMEAKMEGLLAAEEKYIEQIEILQEKLHDTLLELEKRQDEADLKIRDLAAQLNNNSKRRDKEKQPLVLTTVNKIKKPPSQGQPNTSLRKLKTFNGKGNVFSISLQVAQSRPSTTTLQETGLIAGTNPTPTKQLPTTTLTEVSSQLTTLQETGLTGEPVSSQLTTLQATEPSLSTTLQATGLTEGTSQTPTKKLSTPTLTEVSSQMTILQATESQINGLDFTPSDDEDFNIIVVEADVHHPNPKPHF